MMFAVEENMLSGDYHSSRLGRLLAFFADLGVFARSILGFAQSSRRLAKPQGAIAMHPGLVDNQPGSNRRNFLIGNSA
jgi:hypothetical protein